VACSCLGLDKHFDVSVSTVDDTFASILSFVPSLDGVYVFDGLLTATRDSDGLVYVARGAGAFKSSGGIASKVSNGDGWVRDYTFDDSVFVYGLQVVGSGPAIVYQVKGGVGESLTWRLRLDIGSPN
jgi:hypothetical protein